MKRRPIKICCPHCGSEDLEFRATVNWSKERQEWIVDEIDGDYQPWCHDCQDEIGYENEPDYKPLSPQEIIELGLMNFDEDT